MSITCLPVSVGVKFIDKELSGPMPSSSGSFFPVGRVNVALRYGKSLGNEMSGRTRFTSHGLPTAGAFLGSTPSTRMMKGLPCT